MKTQIVLAKDLECGMKIIPWADIEFTVSSVSKGPDGVKVSVRDSDNKESNFLCYEHSEFSQVVPEYKTSHFERILRESLVGKELFYGGANRGKITDVMICKTLIQVETNYGTVHDYHNTEEITVVF
ncbi:hypothetical protein HPMBJEAJ_00090 [Aeromonas phage avDM6]|nr:hypothetical protein HPMBJEAJ_00090 [Aeromonas phage avDM6]